MVYIVTTDQTACDMLPGTQPAPINYEEWLNLTLRVPCNITDVRWHAADTKQNLKRVFQNLTPDSVYIIENENRSSCDQWNTSKEFNFNVLMTEQTHGLLKSVVYAYGFHHLSTDPGCISFPIATYTIAIGEA